MLDRFIRTVRWLSKIFGWIAAALLVASVLVVCHLVFVRYILNESAIWQHEFVTFSLIACTFLGSPYVLQQRGHVNVDLMPLYANHKWRMVLAFLAMAISLAFCLTIALVGYDWWHEAWAKGWRAETVWAPPLWIPYLSMPLGMGLLSLQYVADFIEVATGRSGPFGIDKGVNPLEVEG